MPRSRATSTFISKMRCSCVLPRSATLKQPQSMALSRAGLVLPVREAVLIDVNIIELNAPELLREHVRILAIAAAAIDDDGKVLRGGIAALGEELLHFVIDVRLPDGVRTRAGDVSLFVDRSSARVEEEHVLVVQRLDVVERDLDVRL